MFKKLLATAATLLLAAGLSVVAVAAPASATHPAVAGTVACNPTTGQWDITWRVTGDTSYPNATATIKTEALNSNKAGETPVLESSFVNKTVKGSQYIEIVQRNATLNVQYDLAIKVQFDTYPQGQLVSQGSSKVKPSGTCSIDYPDKSLSVVCTAVTGVWGQALTTAFHINMRVHTSADPNTKLSLSAYVDQNVPGGYSGNGLNGLGVRITDTNGTQTTVPLTEQQWKSGEWVFNFASYVKQSTSYVVEWVQFDDLHFNQDDVPGGWLDCTTTTPDASAALTTSVATCDAASALVLGTVTNATWGTPVYSGTDNLDYSVVATATLGHIFPAGAGVSPDGKTATFTGTLDPKKTTGCAPPEEQCLPKSQVSYTYFPWSNSGVITVTPLPGYTDELCDDFYVTVATWTYDKSDNVWPQTLKETQELHIDKVDSYDYGLPIVCGQGDVYASFTEQPVPHGFLTGPGQPYEPGFLHNMGFTGPAPTFMQTKPGCNVVTPAVPTVDVIEKCGQYGSVIAEDTAEVDYTIAGTGGQGAYTVTAAVKPGYILAEDATTEWEFDLGTYSDCVDPKVSFELGACYPDGDISSKNVYFTFDNSLSDGPVTFTIPGAGVSQLVAAHSTLENFEVGTISHLGGEYDVYANGELLKHFVVEPFDQCQEDIIPGDPKDSPMICTNGVLTDGYIWVDLIPGKLQYTIHDVANNTDIVVTEAETYLPAGEYIVSVVGINGFTVALPDDWKHEITIGTPENCDVIEVPVLAEPTPIVCATGEGSYVLPKSEFIDWYVDGVKVPADAPEKTVVTEAGTVNIEAKINTEGISFPEGADTTWEFAFVAPDDCIELPPLAIVTPVYETSALSCTAAGTFTLGELEPGTISWTVNGEPATIGQHTVTAPGSYELVAAPAIEGDGLNPDWPYNAQNPLVLTFAFADGGCDVKTLALTGVAGVGGMTLLGGLLVAGGMMFFFLRRRTAAE